nr:ATP-binding protein [uncultured Catonella sp.]
MLKKFKVKNYKNFKDEIVIDFENHGEYQFNKDCISNDLISKMLIYGRNATGKTNLGKALLDINYTMFGDIRYSENEILLNADSKEDVVAFSYTFKFDEKEVIYQYSKLSNQELSSEELYVDGVTVFKCNFIKEMYDFENLKNVYAETANTERYLQSLEFSKKTKISDAKLPFLRWIFNNVALNSESVLLSLYSYVVRMIMITVGSAIHGAKGLNQNFYELLNNGDELKKFEEFLNFMGVECKLVLKKLPDEQQELYFGYERLIPFFENASSGTLILTDLYRKLVIDLVNSSLIYLDEFDAFYHYEMAEKVVLFFKNKYSYSQLIMTTHNTNLMTNRIMRPDCLFILSGEGKLTALCNATKRELREGHNLEKMYISGEFDEYE